MIYSRGTVLLLEEIMQHIQYDPHTAKKKKVSLSNTHLSPSITLHAWTNANTHIAHTFCADQQQRRRWRRVCVFRPTGGFDIV